MVAPHLSFVGPAFVRAVCGVALSARLGVLTCGGTSEISIGVVVINVVTRGPRCDTATYVCCRPSFAMGAVMMSMRLSGPTTSESRFNRLTKGSALVHGALRCCQRD